MKTTLTILVGLVHSQTTYSSVYNGPYAGDWTAPSRYPQFLDFADGGETCLLTKVTACRYEVTSKLLCYGKMEFSNCGTIEAFSSYCSPLRGTEACDEVPIPLDFVLT